MGRGERAQAASWSPADCLGRRARPDGVPSRSWRRRSASRTLAASSGRARSSRYFLFFDDAVKRPTRDTEHLGDLRLGPISVLGRSPSWADLRLGPISVLGRSPSWADLRLGPIERRQNLLALSSPGCMGGRPRSGSFSIIGSSSLRGCRTHPADGVAGADQCREVANISLYASDPAHEQFKASGRLLCLHEWCKRPWRGCEHHRPGLPRGQQHQHQNPFPRAPFSGP
jgi:hypothetical protein